MNLLSWGANSYGQLGLGYRSEVVDNPAVVDVNNLIESGEEDLKHIKSICGGGGHTLILTEKGSVYGCGWNNIGQLTTLNDDVVLKLTKLKALEEYKIVDLASTWDSCYAITEDGLCIGWGSNVYSQLGRHNKEKNSETPIVLAEDTQQVACGVRHCIILLRDRRLLSCGDYKYGQIGRKTAILDHSFSEGLRNVKSISCGFNHTLALLNNGEVFGWGINKWGQLGIDPTDCQWSGKPACIPLTEAYNIKEVHCGWSSSHLLTDDGFLINFGRNNYGQLGNGIPESTFQPTKLEKFKFKKVSIGSEHCLGLNEKGELLSWGWNEHGSCGNGDTKNLMQPTKISYSYSRPCKNFKAAAGHNYLIIE